MRRVGDGTTAGESRRAAAPHPGISRRRAGARALFGRGPDPSNPGQRLLDLTASLIVSPQQAEGACPDGSRCGPTAARYAPREFEAALQSAGRSKSRSKEVAGSRSAALRTRLRAGWHSLDWDATTKPAARSMLALFRTPSNPGASAHCASRSSRTTPEVSQAHRFRNSTPSSDV